MQYGFSIGTCETLTITQFNTNNIDDMGIDIVNIPHAINATLTASHSKMFDSFHDLIQFVGDEKVLSISYDIDYNLHGNNIRLNYYPNSNDGLTNKLYYKGLTFYLVGFTNDNDRIYKSLDELHHAAIITAPADYDGALIGTVDACFRTSDDDDMVRYFDSITGIEEA